MLERLVSLKKERYKAQEIRYLRDQPAFADSLYMEGRMWDMMRAHHIFFEAPGSDERVILESGDKLR